MLYQRTILRPVRCTGFGLHSGALVHLSIKPAEPSTGIRFLRTDIYNSRPIKACPTSVVDTKLATSLGNGTCKIGTVEHLMAAIFAMGIDNLLVEVDGPEIPILDGSAAPFIFLLKTSGIVKQDGFKRFMVLNKTVKVREDGKKALIRPSGRFEVNYTIEFNHPLIGTQSFTFIPGEMDFHKEISRARTFGFLKDVELMKKNGLALGGSLENAVVLDKFRVINPDGLRYQDEFVRHKITDAMGDLALIGAIPVGRFEAYKAGHQINNRLVRKLLSDRSAWTILEPDKDREQESLPFDPVTWQDLSPATSV
ncbi:MAG: UDP-3-O-acyl-N-acetylglucosamine deacetylase [Deltaproteobacteria bacterium]|nr:UDP-3-O-acyl-N-acetylglucosamine deacetylase [Deltaproteobacteria bacterium]